MTQEKPTVDITKYVIDQNNILLDIKRWLVEHIGPAENAESITCRKGEGWEISFKSEMDGDTYKYRIIVEFDRDDEALMFKIVWS